MQAHQQNPEESQTVTVRQMRNATEPQVDTKPVTVHISSCQGMDSLELEKWRELLYTADEPVELVGDPASAAIILVVGFDQTNWFKVLRGNSVWKRFPEKNFGISEGDSPPRFLRGLYSGVPKKWNRMKRFSGLAYHWRRQQYPNPVPPPADIAAAAKKYPFFQHRQIQSSGPPQNPQVLPWRTVGLRGGFHRGVQPIHFDYRAGEQTRVLLDYHEGVEVWPLPCRGIAIQHPAV